MIRCSVKLTGVAKSRNGSQLSNGIRSCSFASRLSMLMHLISGGLRVHVVHSNAAISNIHFVLVELAECFP